MRGNTTDFFKGRTLVIATKHKKETVMAPLLKDHLNVTCMTAPDLDTDVLGTFTGEIERVDDPLSTARKKCLMAMALTGCDLAVASEGSFGPHPFIGFVNADDEVLVLVDRKNDLETVTREVSIATNFGGREIKTEEELLGFAKEAQFPSHRLILRKTLGHPLELTKGIGSRASLKRIFADYKAKYGSAYVETDMRAMYNPTRMNVIKLVTQKLVNRMLSCCPRCDTPGFGVCRSREGLPCANCGFPTRSILLHEYCCAKCQYQKEERYPNGKVTEEPTFCDICNP